MTLHAVSSKLWNNCLSACAWFHLELDHDIVTSYTIKVYPRGQIAKIHQQFNTLYFFKFQWFYLEFQQLYSQWQESKYSNIKPVTSMYNFLYIRLIEPGAA